MNYAQIKGWKKVKNDVIVTYYPDDLKKGQNFYVILYPPQKIKDQDKKDFFQKFAQKLEKRFTGTESYWKIKTEADNVFVTKKDLFYKGAIRVFLLKTIETNNGDVQVIQIVHDKDADYAKTYFNRISAIFDDIEKPSLEYAKTEKSYLGYKKPSFKNIENKIRYKYYFLYGYIDYDINGANGIFEAALFFNDGTCSKYVNNIFTKGIAFSKNNNPTTLGKISFIW